MLHPVNSTDIIEIVTKSRRSRPVYDDNSVESLESWRKMSDQRFLRVLSLFNCSLFAK